MRKTSAALLAVATGVLAAGLALAVSPAQATTITPSGDPCKIGTAFYQNDDEQAFAPTRLPGGFTFEGKDLVHHAITTPIDFADMDKVSYSFVASTAGKVVFKVETANPYSTVITNADGKVWSTAMTYDQEGGQGHPVAKYTDLIGKPTKPGKAAFTGLSTVTTFGVGYWVEEGSTVVSSITFHGKTYKLGCNIPTHRPPTRPGGHHPTTRPTTSPTATPTSTAPTTTPPTTRPTTVPPTSRPATVEPSSSSTTPPPVIGVADTSGGDNLPLTGPPLALIAGGGVAIVIVGLALFLVIGRRRKVDFTA